MAPSGDSLTNGDHQTVNGVETNGHGGFPVNDYTIPLNDQYAFTPRRLRVVTIGAGFSGLMLAQYVSNRSTSLTFRLNSISY